MASIPSKGIALIALVASAYGADVTTKQFVAGDGTGYMYDYAPKGNASLPTVLLLHGFPSTRHDWYHQVKKLSEAGFGVLAPDVLGFGESDKPLDLSAYRSKRIAGHLAELLDSESIDKVVGVGHDWGSGLLSTTYVWHPTRFEKVAFLSVGYLPPSSFIDVDTINALSLEAAGYTQLGYWYFFNHFTADEVIGDHLESFYSAIYAANSLAMVQNFAHIGSLRAWLNKNTTTELAVWDTEEHKDTWLRLFSQKGAVTASLSPYRRAMRGVDLPDQAELQEEDLVIKVPVLIIGTSNDSLAPGSQMSLSTKPFASKGLEEHQLIGGHWLMFENSEEVNSILINFATPGLD